MANRSVDLSGEVFGLLTVVGRGGRERVPNGRVESVWVCRCECGVEVSVRRSFLVKGTKRYCSREQHDDEFRSAAGRPRKGAGDVSV